MWTANNNYKNRLRSNKKAIDETAQITNIARIENLLDNKRLSSASTAVKQDCAKYCAYRAALNTAVKQEQDCKNELLNLLFFSNQKIIQFH